MERQLDNKSKLLRESEVAATQIHIQLERNKLACEDLELARKSAILTSEHAIEV